MNRPLGLLLLAPLLTAAVFWAGFMPPSQVPSTVPTFYKDVVPILQHQCQACHRPQGENLGGLIAPMSLMTYNEVRPWAPAIARAVQSHAMPPWFASNDTRGVFANERGLTSAQIATIVTWARAGAPAGRQADAPPPPRVVDDVAKGWSLGEPNLAVSAEPYWLADEVSDDMVTYDVGKLPADVWVQGVEFRAGSSAVHHMCGSAVLPGGASDGADLRTALGCAAPGTKPQMLPDGYSYLLPKGAAIELSIHFHKKSGQGTGVWDNSQVGLTFSKAPVHHRVRTNPAFNFTFEIPPGHNDWRVGAVRVFDAETTILGLWPHGHSRTVAATYWAIYPDGRKELLLDVPRYDYRWETLYSYRTPKTIPAGTRIEVLYRFNNSLARAGQKGFDSTQPVRYGPSGDDEMMLAYVTYAEADLNGHVGSDATRATSDVAVHDFAAHNDAVDVERFRLGMTSLPGHAGVTVTFPNLTAEDPSLSTVETLRPGAVVSYVGGPVIKMRTDVNLRFGQVPISPGNVTVGYAGLYGLWLKKSAAGWRLVMTNQPDVWGTQYEASANVAEIPLRYERLQSVQPLTARLEGGDGSSHLVIAWGHHQWVADVVVQR